ncbi:unnamed protein product [Cochlearia groenlandica]
MQLHRLPLLGISELGARGARTCRLLRAVPESSRSRSWWNKIRWISACLPLKKMQIHTKEDWSARQESRGVGTSQRVKAAQDSVISWSKDIASSSS